MGDDVDLEVAGLAVGQRHDQPDGETDDDALNPGLKLNLGQPLFAGWETALGAGYTAKEFNR